MKFAEESCITMEHCVRAGMPVLMLSAGQAGATAPAPLALTIVQAVAECLSGVVYVNAMRPGHPAIFGTWPFVCDLRTGAMSGGSAEQALLTAGCAQMHAVLRAPRRGGGGHLGQQGARHAGGLGAGDHQHACRAVGAEPRLRGGGDARVASRLLP